MQALKTVHLHDPSGPPDPKALFSRLAAFSARNRRSVISVWLLVAFAAAPLALTLTNALSGAGWEAQGSTAQKVRARAGREPGQEQDQQQLALQAALCLIPAHDAAVDRQLPEPQRVLRADWSGPRAASQVPRPLRRCESPKAI